MDKMSNTEKVMKSLLESRDKRESSKVEKKKMIRVVKEEQEARIPGILYDPTPGDFPVSTKPVIAREVHRKYGRGTYLDNNPGWESSFPVSYETAKQIISDYNLRVISDNRETRDISATGKVADTRSGGEVYIEISRMKCIIFAKYPVSNKYKSSI